MNEYIKQHDLDIAKPLYDLVNDEIIPDTGISTTGFWKSFATIVAELAPQNKALLQHRDKLQASINSWHKQHQQHDASAYYDFLKSIAYLVERPAPFQISTENVDPEIASLAGPQLVSPLDNPRYILNAVNARWGSLYDALYSTDVVSEAEGCRLGKKYNPIRGDKVIRLARDFLDRHFALESDTHSHVIRYFIAHGQLEVLMGDGSITSLLKPQQFVGYIGAPDAPDKVLLCHHGLHVELCFGEGYFIARRDHANLYDIKLESALTTIMDCEDSVASVDVADKVRVYRNWLGLMQGTLTETIQKDDKTIMRSMNPDKQYKNAQGKAITIPARSQLLIRHVGAHLLSTAVTFQGNPVPETIIDAMVTTLAAKHNLSANSTLKNSKTGAIYIVKPKMHGPDEVALANRLFDAVESELQLPPYTMKMGIMDEERRTSVNLSACIAAAKKRLIFINTGFLDRTGDDIHTNMEAGPIAPKHELKHAAWLQAYEASNIQVGLCCGLQGRAQIGKGMWAMPDAMHDMMKVKIQHLKSGASTAWVPSPTAATLHAIHYHRLNIHSLQQSLLSVAEIPVQDILQIPLLAKDRTFSAIEIRQELENNAQAILGYVSRWVGQGIGCSKVPDLHDVMLMEDCATLRISSQHIANWLHHGIVSEAEVLDTMRRMATLVDRQNRDESGYQRMADDFDNSLPFLAALDLILQGRQQANGYTEFILYHRRQQMKEAAQHKEN